MLPTATALQSIAGQWRTGTGASLHRIVDPALEDELRTYPAAGLGDIQEALQATVSGFIDWRQRSALDRSAMLRRAAVLLRERAPAIADLLTREQSNPLVEAGREIEQAAQMIAWSAEEGRRVHGQTIPSRFSGTPFSTQRHPLGPVAGFTPWNFPVMLSAIRVSAALAAGYSIILKPAEEAPLAVAEMLRCFHEAGVPGNALQMLVGVASEISSELSAAKAIRKVSFTGSQLVGRLHAQQLGQALKPIILELDGHAPVIVCEDADVDRVVATLGQIKLRNAGQICANPSRFLVHSSFFEALVGNFSKLCADVKLGSGLDGFNTMGPRVNARRLHAVSSLVADARERGSRIGCGGQRQGDRGFFTRQRRWPTCRCRPV